MNLTTTYVWNVWRKLSMYWFRRINFYLNYVGGTVDETYKPTILFQSHHRHCVREFTFTLIDWVCEYTFDVITILCVKFQIEAFVTTLSEEIFWQCQYLKMFLLLGKKKNSLFYFPSQLLHLHIHSCFYRHSKNILYTRFLCTRNQTKIPQTLFHLKENTALFYPDIFLDILDLYG